MTIPSQQVVTGAALDAGHSLACDESRHASAAGDLCASCGCNGRLVAQDDRLGYPHHGWRPGDVFVQMHRITVPKETAPGKYQIKLGVYYRDTGARWSVAGGDAVVLDDQVTVTDAQ